MQKKWLIGAGKMLTTVGVLALQGGVAEHIKHLNILKNVKAIKVKKVADLNKCQGLIIPGGESTAIRKLIRKYDFKDPLLKFHDQKKPIWGTCAGLILLAQNVEGENKDQLGLLKIKVKRNAFGSQLNSFIEKALIKEVAEKPQELIFIRAPLITEIAGDLKILYQKNNQIFAVENDYLLGTSFHPELSEDSSFHKYFVNKIRKVS